MNNTDKPESLPALLQRRRLHPRRGTAAVELAVCLPMLTLLVFGSIQACNLIFLKHAITSAAYEGTLELVRPSSTNESVTARVDQVLAMHNLKNTKVTLLPNGTQLEKLLPGSPVQIQVSADVKTNLPLHGWFPTADTMSYTVASPR